MAKRWTIPFISQANKQCRIDIYDPTWSGSVTELSITNSSAPGVASTDPFYYEEEDDEDLLKVLRYKTGYINLVEIVQDGLLDLLPTELKSRYVEVYYDNTITFRGYIQQQNFENEWVSVPREVSLPVISVMGIAESMNFEPEMGISDQKIGYYMKKVLRAVEPYESSAVKYSYVTFPENGGNNFAGDFAATIRPLVTTIKNSSFSKVYGGHSNPYAGLSMHDFLEGLCNAYGWILHDMADRILFTKYDNNRDYASYPVNYNSTADIETATGKTSEGSEGLTELADIMQPSNDDGTITQIMPLRKITIKNSVDMKTSAKAEFENMRCSQLFTATIDNQKSALAFLANANDNIKDIASSNLLTAPGITDWLFNQDGVAVLDFKSKKRVIVQRPGNWQNSGNLFTLYLYDRPLRDPDNYIDGNLKLELDCSWGSNLLGIGGYETLTWDVPLIRIILYCGLTQIATKDVSFNDEGNHIQTLEFDNVTIPSTGTMWLTFTALNASNDFFANKLLSFDGIRLYYDQPVTIDYLVDNNDLILIGDSGGFDDASIDMLMSCRFVNSHTINNNFPIPQAADFTNYSYLRHPQNRLKLRMKTKPQQTFDVLQTYINKIKYWQSSWRWRLIATAFHPWDDEWTLTMHRSSTLE